MRKKAKKLLPHKSVVLVGTAIAFSLFGDQALYAILPVYFEELGLKFWQVGLLLSVNRWVRLLTNHLAERLTRHYSPTRLLTASLILGSVLTVIYGTVSSFAILLIARMLWGLCWSFLRQVGVMTSVDSTSGKNVARTMGFYTGIVRTGSIIGVSLGAILFDFIGFTQTFLLFGMASLLGVPLGRIARKNLPTRHSDFRRPRPRERLHHIFPLLVCGFVSGCVIPGIITATLGYVLKSRVGESVEMLALVLPIATINGIFLALRNIINTAGAPAFGLVVDRIGYRRVALIVSSIATVFLIGTSVASTPYMVVLLLGVFVCGTALMVVFNAEAVRRGSRVNAAYVSSIDFGAAVGPMIGWYMIALIPSPTMIFAVGAALYAIATVFSSSACRTSSDTGMSDEAEASEETGKEPIQF